MKAIYTVGENVTAEFNDDRKSIILHSENGTLWADWPDKAGIPRNKVSSIRVTKGIVHLP